MSACQSMTKRKMYKKVEKNLKSLITRLGEVRKKYGSSLQKPTTIEDIERLINAVNEKFGTQLSLVYQRILLITNGFNENGVYLYGSKTALIEGSSDLYLEGLIEANMTWHESYNGFSNHLFYAESDIYLFCQSLENKIFTCHSKDSFGDYLVFETVDENEFFEKIFKLAIDDDFSLE
jgi:hypothetical protein